MTEVNWDDIAQATAPKAEGLKTLTELIQKAAAKAGEVEYFERCLKDAKAELHELTTKTLPDAMAEAGVSEFKTPDGLKVAIKEFVNGSLPKDDERREAALDWLAKNGAEDLIKGELVVVVAKGQDNMAGEIRAKVEELGLSYTQDRGVHPQTLYAFARERLRNGEELPVETLGLFIGRAAKVEMPKKAKGQ